MATALETRTTKPDVEKYRLRHFIERMIGLDEVEVHDEPVPLMRLGHHLHGNKRAVLFRKAGPGGQEVVGNVLAGRRRIAEAFGADVKTVATTVRDRLARPLPAVEISSPDAPVHQLVSTGEKVDLTALPVHLQHDYDGAPYISAGIDFAVDPETGRVNMGCRRLMLRGRRSCGIDIGLVNDLYAMYRKAVAQKQRLPISFVVGAHPVDYVAATMRVDAEEPGLIGTLRGEPLPVVRCVTNDLLVPADAEMVIEGYLDERGFAEDEGPYGEFYGYYGGMKKNPVFHATAICTRRDPLFQTVTISGQKLAQTEVAQIESLVTESVIWKTLETAVREPVAVYATPASSGLANVRVALRQRVPGEARNAIAAVLGSLANVKHVFVVDEDIDVFSDEEMEWALATRFQADRDLVVSENMRVIPLDPSLEGKRTGAKAGFDLTLPFGKKGSLEYTAPAPPATEAPARFQTVRQALAARPMRFAELAAALGSDDGREIVREIEALREAGQIVREGKGEYRLKDGA